MSTESSTKSVKIVISTNEPGRGSIILEKRLRGGSGVPVSICLYDGAMNGLTIEQAKLFRDGLTELLKEGGQ